MQDLREARDRCADLLADPHSLERDWQCLFAKYPFILTDCLSLDIAPNRLVPCQPGRAEADFYFYPETENPLSPYGVIEIKRPATNILSVPRKDVICLSADATTAVAQASKYAAELTAAVAQRPSRLLALGTALHIFVIAGLSAEIARKVTDRLRSQFATLLPPGCRLVPFDVLSELLNQRVPPQLHIVVPWRSPFIDASKALDSQSAAEEHPATADISEGDDEQGTHRADVRGGLTDHLDQWAKEHPMHSIHCTECRAEGFVPFMPMKGKPVYCRDCYSKRKRY